MPQQTVCRANPCDLLTQTFYTVLLEERGALGRVWNSDTLCALHAKLYAIDAAERGYVNVRTVRA